MNLILTDDTPVHQRPRRLSFREIAEVERQINKRLEEGIVRPSNSEFASPIVLVVEKNGEIRICIDYRKLNKKIVKDRYPSPLIEDQLDRLQGAKVFTALDLKNGFFHVDVAEESRKYTSFVTPNGQYEFLKMSFELRNSPSVFQRFINAVFREVIAKNIVLTYMDDLIVPAANEIGAIENLRNVTDIAEKAGLMINWEKYKFLQTRIEYLGHVIEGGTVKPSENKIKAVMKFPEPTCVWDVQSFLGLTGYFCKFIPKYARVARALSNLLRSGVTFIFGVEEKRTFDELKIALRSQPVMHL